MVPDFAAAAEGSITKGDIVVAIDGVQVLFFLLVAFYSSTCITEYSTNLAWGDRSFLQQNVFLCASLSCFFCTRTISGILASGHRQFTYWLFFRCLCLFLSPSLTHMHHTLAYACVLCVTLQAKGKELHAVKQLTIGEVGTVYLAPRA